MKNRFKILRMIIILGMLLAAGQLFAQDKDEFHSLSLITAPGTYIDFGHDNYTDDGFNLGFNMSTKIIQFTMVVSYLYFQI